MSVFIHNTIFAVQNGVKRNEGSIENQWDSSFVGTTKLLYFQTYDKLRTFKTRKYNLRPHNKSCEVFLFDTICISYL